MTDQLAILPQAPGTPTGSLGGGDDNKLASSASSSGKGSDSGHDHGHVHSAVPGASEGEQKVKVHWFRSTFTQATILGVCSFLAPGLWGGMTLLGAGGSQSPSLVNAANSIT